MMNQKDQLFLASLYDLQTRHDKESQKNCEIDEIGKSFWGLPNLIAQYDIEKNNKKSGGSFLPVIENTVNAALAKLVLLSIPRLISVLNALKEANITSPESAIDGTPIDSKIYAKDNQLWLKTQSHAYVLKVAGSLDLKTENLGYLDALSFKYSARLISQNKWEKTKIPKDAFNYGDSRDPGYCGTLSYGCSPEIKDGYFYTREFSRCFNAFFYIDLENLGLDNK